MISSTGEIFSHVQSPSLRMFTSPRRFCQTQSFLSFFIPCLERMIGRHPPRLSLTSKRYSRSKIMFRDCAATVASVPVRPQICYSDQQLSQLTRTADKDIGIITPYHAQCLKLRSSLRGVADGVKVGSVEEFQGQVRSRCSCHRL